MEERDDGLVILGRSCPLADVVKGHPETCLIAEALLTEVIGSPVQINFTGNTSDTASSFTLQTVSTVNGTFADVSSTITGGSGAFQATVPVGGATQFYRIRHN